MGPCEPSPHLCLTSLVVSFSFSSCLSSSCSLSLFLHLFLIVCQSRRFFVYFCLSSTQPQNPPPRLSPFLILSPQQTHILPPAPARCLCLPSFFFFFFFDITQRCVVWHSSSPFFFLCEGAGRGVCWWCEGLGNERESPSPLRAPPSAAGKATKGVQVR